MPFSQVAAFSVVAVVASSASASADAWPNAHALRAWKAWT